MKTINRILIITLTFIFLSSCEKVIEIDLNSSNPVLVAEGEIVKGEYAWIKLSYTSDYFEVEETVFEENAVVTLSDDKGNSEILSHAEKGYYVGSEICGEQNTLYTMTVEVGDDKYVAETEIMYAIDQLELEVGLNDFGGFGPGAGGEYTVTCIFPDDVDVSNHFIAEFVIIKNTADGEEVDSYDNLFEDVNFENDGVVRYKAMRSAHEEGDLVMVKINAVDEKVYEFYSQMDDVSSGNPMNSSSPYNPKSNFSGDILGCFKGVSGIEGQIIISADLIN
jgi:hypothetical protein